MPQFYVDGYFIAEGMRDRSGKPAAMRNEWRGLAADSPADAEEKNKADSPRIFVQFFLGINL